MKKLICILLLAGAAAAQDFRVNLAGTVATGGGAYVTPKITLSVEPRAEWRRAGIAGSVAVIPTGKADTRDGVTLAERAEGYGRFGTWRAGCGVSQSNLWTSLYSKRATRPYALVGYRDEYMDIGVRYFLPAGDRRNGLTGPEFIADFAVKGRFSLRVRGDLYSIYPTDAPQLGRRIFTSAGGGIVWRLK